MEQFSLEKCLQDKRRKVVTRSGHNVRILCTDQRGNMPIVALVEFETLDGVQIFYSDGKNESHREYDLFFADEEGLSEFEKEVKDLMNSCCNEIGETIVTDEWAKDTASALLDLARKELMSEISDFEIYDKGFKEGKKYALKDLPKWKKSTEKKDFDRYVLLFEDEDRVVLATELYKNEYYIELEDLKTLPKEE